MNMDSYLNMQMDVEKLEYITKEKSHIFKLHI